MVPQQQRRRRRRAALARTSERRLVVARGAGGFGFTIAGQRPCVVSAVASGGPAERAGLRAGDALIAVDGASVARAPHASVARMVAAAPGAIALSVAPREAPPTDTEDTEPDERARTRRRHPPPRRRPQPALMHHPACHAAPSTSGVNEILQNLSRVQLTPTQAARLECRAVVGYLGTIETPQAAPNAAPGNVRTAVRKLRQERRPAAPVLLSVLPNVLYLRRPSGQILAQYPRERILYAGCGSDADRRYFGLVTAAESSDNDTEASHSCHVFAVDPRMAEHEAHVARAREFQITCTRDPVAERCLEFPPSAEYVVGIVKGMYSLPADDCNSPSLLQLSKLAVKGDSPAFGNFSRCNRAVFRVPRERRPCRHDARVEPQEFVANSPQPSNHSEITTTSSNSDSGIGFHNDGRNIADRILVVDFAGPQPPVNRFRQEMPRRPLGLVGCSSFDADGSFLSNTTPVVDGFAGQGRPLNLDDVILNNDLQPVRHVSPRNEEDNYNYNNLYGNAASSSRSFQNGVLYDQVYTENEGHHYEFIPPQLDMDIEIDRIAETFNSVEIYEEKLSEYRSNESVENMTEVSGNSKSMDTVSMYSTRSHEEARPALRKHLQASLDDMLVLGLRDPLPVQKDDDNFHILTGREREKKLEARSRALSASAVWDKPKPAVQVKQEVIVKDEPGVETDCSKNDVVNLLKAEQPTLILLQPADNRCRLADLEEGRIGSLRVHQSGRVTLALGDTIFEAKRLRGGIDEFLEKVFLTDGCLLYAPSQIALAAVLHAASKEQENLDSYVTEMLFRDAGPDKLAILIEAVRKIRSLVKMVESPAKERVRIIDKKLDRCRNEENNPDSEIYKRRMREALDEDDLVYTGQTRMSLDTSGITQSEAERLLACKYIPILFKDHHSPRISNRDISK
ncbi:hypothetical protein MSG28_011682 [Choristoneura fumiferana]|uniref:Uncharacterized protein n=1 Tax=Choristoneura fumiferana TaxID=7141 RepID=A0ACC0KL80_CHOFU|nr:hypothetical protein MSG28_011682 [Choristoneura fumiferana]